MCGFEADALCRRAQFSRLHRERNKSRRERQQKDRIAKTISEYK